MESVNQPIKELRGRKGGGAGGPPSEVRALLFAPEASKDDRDYSWLVRCPAIFENDKRIFGVNEHQALELAEQLVTEMFEHYGIELVATTDRGKERD